ncbi:GNAT family N-acetyltransferase [Angustibacter aerolatus]
MSAPWPADGLRADGVLLRRWRLADLDARLAMYDAESARWSPPVFEHTRELVAERLQAEVAQEHDPEPPATLAIAAADDPDRLLGSMDWRNGFPAPFSIRDVGYAVAPEARGRGVASTALRLITEWLLDPTGGDVVRVQLDHAVANVASCRTALRAGFRVEGVRERFLPLRESPDAPLVMHDVCMHGRVRPLPS